MGEFMVFLPPPWPPRIRTSVRMVDAIVGWVDREWEDTTPPRMDRMARPGAP